MPTPVKDHPRVCGEKIYSVRDNIAEQGSPPRMRGKAKFTRRAQRDYRITPACAGKRLYYSCAPAILEDHPRMCGEKTIYVDTYPGTLGSPPHVRGKVCRLGSKTVSAGITPACAGKSVEKIVKNLLNWDHPRMCGEKPLSL